MIVTDIKTGRVTFFITQKRQLEMSAEEYQHFEGLIRNPPPVREIREMPKPWSPCVGEGCTHPIHKKD